MSKLSSLSTPRRRSAVRSWLTGLAASALLFSTAAYSQTWTDYGGHWTHAGNTHTVDGGAGSKSLLSGAALQSSTMEADVSVGPGGNAGFVFRTGSPGVGPDAYNGYYVGLDTQNNAVVLGRAANSWTQLTSYPLQVNPDTPYHLKLVSYNKGIEVYVNNAHIVSAGDDVYLSGSAGLRTMNAAASFANLTITDNGNVPVPTWDFSGVKGAVYTPTNAVNYIDWWQNYDPAIVDRELSYAQVYGINTVAIYLHFLVWQNDSQGALNKFENFLKLADKHGIKVSPIFFDDCWDPNPHLGDQGAPIPGRHNSRWVQSPGQAVKDSYLASYKPAIRQYVQDFVNPHKADRRIVFWEQMNEPGCNSSGPQLDTSKLLMNDARIAIKDTGTKIPVGSPSVQIWDGWYFSDFFSFHPYGGDYPGPFGANVINTESMNRGSQSVPGIVSHYGGAGTGYMMWEFGIGRTNTRFPWGSPDGAPEPATPFHGIAYPDGHPWSTGDVVALNGVTANMAAYSVDYFNGKFAQLIKSSVAPMIDFDLNTERGTASPDASAGVAETNYSVRWQGTVRPTQSNTYTFYADSDKVARVWVNNVLLVKKTAAGRATAQGQMALTAGTNYPVKVEYVHAAGPSHMHVTWSSSTMSRRPLTVLAPAFLPAYVRFSPAALPGDFIRHRDGRGRIEPDVAPAADSQWRVVPGLADPLGVSLESVNYPGEYLRQRNGEIWREANDGSARFGGDATWRPRVGWSNPAEVSFESFTNPGNFIRHRDFLLYSEPVLPSSSALDKSDATFLIN